MTGDGAAGEVRIGRRVRDGGEAHLLCYAHPPRTGTSEKFLCNSKCLRNPAFPHEAGPQQGFPL